MKTALLLLEARVNLHETAISGCFCLRTTHELLTNLEVAHLMNATLGFTHFPHGQCFLSQIDTINIRIALGPVSPCYYLPCILPNPLFLLSSYKLAPPTPKCTPTAHRSALRWAHLPILLRLNILPRFTFIPFSQILSLLYQVCVSQLCPHCRQRTALATQQREVFQSWSSFPLFDGILQHILHLLLVTRLISLHKIVRLPSSTKRFLHVHRASRLSTMHN